MNVSLKKQIHCKKISEFIKTKNIVLFFAILDLPQRSTVLKRQNAFYNLPTLKHTEYGSIFPLDASFSQKKADIKCLYVSNKCLKNIESCSNLPLYGQTLLVACGREEQAAHAITVTSSLYMGVLLGGFYKNTVQTKTFLKALCVAANRKKEIYIKCLRLLSYNNYKNLRVTAATYCKTIALLQELGKLKGKIYTHPPEKEIDA